MPSVVLLLIVHILFDSTFLPLQDIHMPAVYTGLFCVLCILTGQFAGIRVNCFVFFVSLCF